MPVNLSIKNVPDELAERLRERAARHHRSLQGELMAILEAAAVPTESLRAADLLARARAAGLKTGNEAVRMIRRDRDGR